MTFRILKVVSWAVLGWSLYRSLAHRQGQEKARPDGPPQPAGDRKPARRRKAKDDLGRVRGIGPGIEKVLNAAGITTWAELAEIDAAALRAILDQAGPRYRGRDPSTWPGQAAELANAN